MTDEQLHVILDLALQHLLTLAPATLAQHVPWLTRQHVRWCLAHHRQLHWADEADAWEAQRLLRAMHALRRDTEGPYEPPDL